MINVYRGAKEAYHYAVTVRITMLPRFVPLRCYCAYHYAVTMRETLVILFPLVLSEGAEYHRAFSSCTINPDYETD
jgi:hypothetical protein